jgi:hypothetical protein
MWMWMLGEIFSSQNIRTIYFIEPCQKKMCLRVKDNIVRMNHLDQPKKIILFLGYGRSQTRLIDLLIANNCIVDHSDQRIETLEGYDCVISFGYKHILEQNVLSDADCPIFNLHISYLPYNRGAHPNFWAFFDNTPSGVTIHLIDGGVDTGPIVKQKYVRFRKVEDTFDKTYSVLIESVEDLFVEFLPSLLADNWAAEPQKGEGSYHRISDLPTNFSGWNSVITEELLRLRRKV